MHRLVKEIGCQPSDAVVIYCPPRPAPPPTPPGPCDCGDELNNTEGGTSLSVNSDGTITGTAPNYVLFTPTGDDPFDPSNPDSTCLFLLDLSSGVMRNGCFTPENLEKMGTYSHAFGNMVQAEGTGDLVFGNNGGTGEAGTTETSNTSFAMINAVGNSNASVGGTMTNATLLLENSTFKETGKLNIIKTQAIDSGTEIIGEFNAVAALLNLANLFVEGDRNKVDGSFANAPIVIRGNGNTLNGHLGNGDILLDGDDLAASVSAPFVTPTQLVVNNTGLDLVVKPPTESTTESVSTEISIHGNVYNGKLPPAINNTNVEFIVDGPLTVTTFTPEGADTAIFIGNCGTLRKIELGLIEVTEENHQLAREMCDNEFSAWIITIDGSVVDDVLVSVGDSSRLNHSRHIYAAVTALLNQVNTNSSFRTMNTLQALPPKGESSSEVGERCFNNDIDTIMYNSNVNIADETVLSSIKAVIQRSSISTKKLGRVNTIKAYIEGEGSSLTTGGVPDDESHGCNSITAQVFSRYGSEDPTSFVPEQGGGDATATFTVSGHNNLSNAYISSVGGDAGPLDPITELNVEGGSGLTTVEITGDSTFSSFRAVTEGGTTQDVDLDGLEAKSTMTLNGNASSMKVNVVTLAGDSLTTGAGVEVESVVKVEGDGSEAVGQLRLEGKDGGDGSSSPRHIDGEISVVGDGSRVGGAVIGEDMDNYATLGLRVEGDGSFAHGLSRFSDLVTVSDLTRVEADGSFAFGRRNMVDKDYSGATGINAYAYLPGSIAHSSLWRESEYGSIQNVTVNLIGGPVDVIPGSPSSYTLSQQLVLSDGTLPTLPHVGSAIVTAQIVGSDPSTYGISSARIVFVVRRLPTTYEIVRESAVDCSDNPSAYTAEADVNGFTIQIEKTLSETLPSIEVPVYTATFNMTMINAQSQTVQLPPNP